MQLLLGAESAFPFQFFDLGLASAVVHLVLQVLAARSHKSVVLAVRVQHMHRPRIGAFLVTGLSLWPDGAEPDGVGWYDGGSGEHFDALGFCCLGEMHLGFLFLYDRLEGGPLCDCGLRPFPNLCEAHAWGQQRAVVADISTGVDLRAVAEEVRRDFLKSGL